MKTATQDLKVANVRIKKKVVEVDNVQEIVEVYKNKYISRIYKKIVEVDNIQESSRSR